MENPLGSECRGSWEFSHSVHRTYREDDLTVWLDLLGELELFGELALPGELELPGEFDLPGELDLFGGLFVPVVPDPPALSLL